MVFLYSGAREVVNSWVMGSKLSADRLLWKRIRSSSLGYSTPPYHPLLLASQMSTVPLVSSKGLR
jgi:hypothetical protein